MLRSSLVALLVSTLVVLGLSHYVPSDSFTQVRLATWEIQGEAGTCSAVAIKPDVLLTAAHCAGVGEMSVNGIKATVLKRDPEKDLMLIYVLGLNSPTVPVATEAPGVDEKVVMAGFPLGVGEVVTEGRVQDITTKAPVGLMLVTAQGIFGNSGGPVLVRRGMHYEVVGIVSAVAVASLGFIPNVIPHLMIVVNTEAINLFLP